MFTEETLRQAVCKQVKRAKSNVLPIEVKSFLYEFIGNINPNYRRDTIQSNWANYESEESNWDEPIEVFYHFDSGFRLSMLRIGKTGKILIYSDFKMIL